MPIQRLALTVVLLAANAASAKVVTETIEYQDGDAQLQGFLVYDDAAEGKRPGVLVVHEWWGLNDYARDRAKQLAELGYVAFALDMYGKGKLAEHPREASQWAAEIRENVQQWQARAQAGLDVLKSREEVDQNRLAAIGYCFGGATVCQLAYAGVGLNGVVSFHGSLPAPTTEQADQIDAKLLICHGAEDPFVPNEQVAIFQNALKEADADWQMIIYSGAEHSFTNPDADQRNINGLSYNQEADKSSWEHMKLFLKGIFKSK